MEASFFKSLDMVLHHEGGFVDHPNDPGGATNKGITHKTYADFLDRPLEDVSELKNIPEEHVQKIYKTGYWDRIRGDELPAGGDFCIFDWAGNSGPEGGAKALQKAVGATVDGAIVAMTVAAVNAADAAKIIEDVTKEREEFYRSLRTFDTFGKGWLRRNKETRDFALEMV